MYDCDADRLYDQDKHIENIKIKCLVILQDPIKKSIYAAIIQCRTQIAYLESSYEIYNDGK